ncbi:MAG: hypothetical protein A2527_10010 [Candidatus Lambdaproteobacteria bacterium RIFOXYD2_FULL_50_16]|uniref:Glycosyltransferase RgtA/B/C/D-like domain-containing protein n=1 Tax=Candidatus Lambdaproteobacteria bacterium RIFOXYD2_FULL_50_16 TaxID=1817772 RepID=A0A1F6G9V1_9PROT|nr:MAG: hypothetical protein A2527_10010 [Candidatus Lambdaproteobacteria bacterium RIFOXYD2_FULL_50_16]
MAPSFLIALFLLWHLLLPIAAISRVRVIHLATKDSGPAFWLAAALVFHLISSIAYRSLFGALGLPFWLYSVLHLGFLYLLWQDRHRWRSWTRDGLAQLGGWGRVLGFLSVATFLIYFFYTTTYKPIAQIYQDEHQRLGIVHAIALAYPPPEFHVFANNSYRYYNFTELWTANLTAFTGLDAGEVYFNWVLPGNWILILAGFWAFANALGKKNQLVLVMAFFFFFFVQGLGGDQKISHLTLRQNTFALGLALLSAALITQYLQNRRNLWLLLGLALASLLVGTKLLMLAPILGALGPLVGYLFFMRPLPLKTYLFPALFFFGLCSFWYFLVVYQPDSGGPALIWDPEHYWAKTYQVKLTEQYHCALAKTLTAWCQALWGTNGSMLWAPIVASLEYWLLALAALLWGGRELLKKPGYWFFALGGWLSQVFFFGFGFEEGASMGSIVYFFIFGAWIFSAATLCLWLEALSLKRTVFGWLVLPLMFGVSMYSYAFADLTHYQGPPTHVSHSPEEVKVMNLIKADTQPTDWVLHNFYKGPRFWSVSGIIGRRTVLSDYVGGSINQDPITYHAVQVDVERFFKGELNREETQAFLTQYQVSAILWMHRYHPYPGADPELFEVRYNQPGITWLRPKKH